MSLSEYRKIIIHAGLHKTGTSYIQSVMNQNSRTLERWGIDYPLFHGTDRYRGNHSIIALNYEEHADVDGLFDRFVDIGNRSPTLLISGEGFTKCLRHNGFLEAFLSVVADADVHFVFYLRRPDHLLESSYAQVVKARFHGDIRDFKEIYDFRRKLSPFIEAVGRDNVTVRPYNRRLWPNGELGADFCAAIGVPDLWPEIAPTSEKIVNPTLNRSEIFLLSRLESRRAKMNLARYLDENRESLRDDGTKFFLSPRDRREFNQRHVEVFRWLGDEFGLYDVDAFLGIEEHEGDPAWNPYRPDWEDLFRCLARFTDTEASTTKPPARKND